MEISSFVKSVVDRQMFNFENLLLLAYIVMVWLSIGIDGQICEFQLETCVWSPRKNKHLLLRIDCPKCIDVLCCTEVFSTP